MSSRQTNTDKLAIIQNDLNYIRDDIKEIKEALKTDYVTKDQFNPVKRIAYGLVTTIIAIFVTSFGYIISYTGRGSK